MSKTVEDESVQRHDKKRKHKEQPENGSSEQVREKSLKKRKRDKKHESRDAADSPNDLEPNTEQALPHEKASEDNTKELKAKKAKKAKSDDDSSEDDKLSKAERKALRKEAKRLKKLKREAKASHDHSDTSAPAEPENPASAESEEAQSGSYSQMASLTSLAESKVKEFLEAHSITVSDPRSQGYRPIVDFEYLPTKQKNEATMFAGFKTPTPIQAAAWPYVLAGRDAVGIAETGSGKTLAFGLPCVRYVSSVPSKQKRKSPVKAVIVSPTRELAMQIHEQLQKLVSGTGVSVTCIYGGVQKDEQRESLTRSNIIVATPGRLNDFIQEGSADLSSVGYVVLDEADRMLDKGFEEEVRKIIGQTPAPECQTLMFTATWPTSIRDLAASFMRDPVKISIGEPTSDLRANTRVTQKVEVVDPRGKEFRLLQLLKEHQSGSKKNDKILVFCLYKKEATRVENFIRSKGFRVAGIHGDMNQPARTASLDAFKSGKVPLLVATDVAARGLDIPAVKLVLNVTFPLTAEDYVHRIGRTGRAGQNGLAITLFTEHDKAQSGALINVLKAANQEVPEELMKFGTTVKKKTHEQYGAFYREPTDGAKKATKITFD